MNKIKFNFLKISLKLALLLTTNLSCRLSNVSRLAKKDQFILNNDWQLREVYSKESNIIHRFYYHHGPHCDSPVLLMLHGLFLDGRGFERMHSLSQKWQLIAYDFPELSPVYRGNMDDFKYLLDDFLDAMSIETIDLCGVSFGGGVALRYCASHPKRVKSLVLLSTFIMNLTYDDRIRSREIAKILLDNSDRKLQKIITMIINIAFHNRPGAQNAVRSILHVKHIDWYKQIIKSITTCEGTEDAAQIKCPVLVLHGDRDKTISSNIARLIPFYIPQAEFKIIENGTHSMMLLEGEYIASQIIKSYNNFVNS